MTIQELDRNYLTSRCNILNAFLEEVIDYDEAKEKLDAVDFKFETLVSFKKIPVLESPKPFDWSKE